MSIDKKYNKTNTENNSTINNQKFNLVETRDNKILTTSLKVAEKFEKRHKHIIQNIKDLLIKFNALKNKDVKFCNENRTVEEITSAENSADLFCNEEIGLLNFEESYFCKEDIQRAENSAGYYIKEITYIDKKGETRSAFEFDKDFFTLLVMSFTGEKAFKFKIDYIAEFNQMKHYIEELKNNKTIQKAIKKKIKKDDDIKRCYLEFDKVLFGVNNKLEYYIFQDSPYFSIISIMNFFNLSIQEFNHIERKNKVKQFGIGYDGYIRICLDFLNFFQLLENEPNLKFQELYKIKNSIYKSVNAFIENSKVYYNATEIGYRFNTTCSCIGKTANRFNLKTEEFGKIEDRGAYHQFLYNKKAIEKFEEIFENNNYLLDN